MFYNQYINYGVEAPFLSSGLSVVSEENCSIFHSENPVLQTTYYCDLVERLGLDDYSKGTISVIQSQLNLLNLQSCLPMPDDFTVSLEGHLADTFFQLRKQKYPDGLTVPYIHGSFLNEPNTYHAQNQGEQAQASRVFCELAEHFSSHVGLLSSDSIDRSVLTYIVKTGLSIAYFNYTSYSRLIELLESYTKVDEQVVNELDINVLSVILGVFVSERYQNKFLFNAGEYISDLKDDLEQQIDISKTHSPQKLLSLTNKLNCDKFVAYHLIQLLQKQVPNELYRKYISELNVFNSISNDELLAMFNESSIAYQQLLFKASFIYQSK